MRYSELDDGVEASRLRPAAHSIVPDARAAVGKLSASPPASPPAGPRGRQRRPCKEHALIPDFERHDFNG